MGRIKNMTIPQTFVFLTVITLLITTAIIALEFTAFEYFRNKIQAPYLKEYEIGPNVRTMIVDVEPEGIDAFIINNIANWQMIAVCLTVGSIILGESLVFYNLKLKKPLDILNKASEKIAGNDLDFHVCYNSSDEMGKLCESFEKMRASLEENYRQMWRNMEERKRLNAAFSHDLRTPLTVLKGYADLLVKYLPQDKLPKEKLISTVSTMSEHISRLESYVISMNALQKLEDIIVCPQPVGFRALLLQLKESAGIITQGREIRISFFEHISMTELRLDVGIVKQVFENLISNAARFAEKEIIIECDVRNDFFRIIVADDGSGFSSEELQKASAPFYRGKKDSDDTHFGLGLNICQILCEKHGGSLVWENGRSGGGVVTASFAGLEAPKVEK